MSRTAPCGHSVRSPRWRTNGCSKPAADGICAVRADGLASVLGSRYPVHTTHGYRRRRSTGGCSRGDARTPRSPARRRGTCEPIRKGGSVSCAASSRRSQSGHPCRRRAHWRGPRQPRTPCSPCVLPWRVRTAPPRSRMSGRRSSRTPAGSLDTLPIRDVVDASTDSGSVGRNGAGRTTAERRRPSGLSFVNADRLARRLRPDATNSRSRKPRQRQTDERATSSRVVLCGDGVAHASRVQLVERPRQTATG